jgi:hypothetical protein
MILLGSVRKCDRTVEEFPMPDASYYVRQAKLLLSISSGAYDPVLLSRCREIAEDYLAKAVMLKMNRRLPLIPKPTELQSHS